MGRFFFFFWRLVLSDTEYEASVVELQQIFMKVILKSKGLSSVDSQGVG